MNVPGRVYALALVPVVMWGTSFASAKIVLANVSPAGLVAVRATLGLGVLALALALMGDARDPLPYTPADRARAFLLGVLGLPVQLGLQSYALTLTSAHHSGWIVAVSPVTTAVLGAIVLRERLPWPKAAGVALGFAGALTVMASAGGSLALPGTRGDLLVLLSAFNWSVYTLIARSMMRRHRSGPMTLRLFAAGTAVAVVFYAVFGHPSELAQVPVRTWLVLGYLGIGCSGIGYLCWSAALRHLEAARLASFQNVQPLVTAVTAAWWVAEPIGAAAVTGGAIILAGVWIVQRGGVALPAGEAS